MLLSTTLAAAGTVRAGPATVGPRPLPAVSLTVPEPAQNDEPLLGWLVVRLLEEGYSVTSDGDAAQIDLAIATTPDLAGWEVVALGQTRARFEVAVGDDPAVTRLELFHRAVDALEAVPPRPAAVDAASVAFAVELDPTLAPQARASGEAQIAGAVLQAGGTLVPDRAAAAFVVCASPGGDALGLALVPTDAACPGPLPAADPTPVSATGQRAFILVTAALAPAAEPEPEPEPEVADPPRPPARDDEVAPGLEAVPAPRGRAWSDSPLVLRGGVAAGVVGRIKAVDPVLAMSWLIGKEPGFSGWLDVQVWLTPKWPTLRVVEVVPAAGVRLRPLTRGRLSVDTGLLLGMQVHRYHFEDRVLTASSSAVGTSFDVSIEAAAGGSFQLWRRHELQLLVRAGRSGRARTHLQDGIPIWHRNAWRIGATLGVSFGGRLGR